MRVTVSVLGFDIVSVEISRTALVDIEPSESDELGGAAGGLFEMGFQSPKPAWSPLSSEPPD